MSDQSTIRMLRAYFQSAAPTMALSGIFRSPRENFHDSEFVELDIERNDEDVAIVIQDLSTGYRMNAADIYTNKRLTPPIFKEAVALNSSDLLKRQPGQNPFENVQFRVTLIDRMFKGMLLIERKIRRSIELQASQIMQTGTITFKDANGVTLFTLSYDPKATHFPTTGTAWASLSTADPVADIVSLAEVIRDDGLQDPDTVIMGSDAFENFVNNDLVKARFDTRRIELGTVAPMELRPNGLTFRGRFDGGNYSYDIWTYGGRYIDPETGNKLQFVDPSKVIVRASGGRMDATFGGIPNIGRELGVTGTLLPELPSRFVNADGGMDLHTNVWLTADGEQLVGGVGARPLLIPTAIDTFGCLETAP